MPLASRGTPSSRESAYGKPPDQPVNLKRFSTPERRFPRQQSFEIILRLTGRQNGTVVVCDPIERQQIEGRLVRKQIHESVGYLLSWKMIPTVFRWPERRRLTP